ncbi:MAG: acetyl-CoA carboxylase biotin carboxyl carrier protein [Thermomicrobium sp.]|nr:acetyl-CoA carboxylase biotin carboxyl carrier protein [Thermomicrobium sp.]MDW8006514.1 acetyl-CoA carboxylase biotin carboxyl carrier protein [Thermomicrobium sp.]
MELTPEDVQEILKLLEQSSFDELYLETPQLKLIVRRGHDGASSVAVPASQPAPASPPPEPATTAQPAEPPAAAESPHAEAAAPGKETLVPIVAPLKGIFYRAPRPGAEPFVDVGSEVREDTVVAIIEVMKLMHSVQAGVRGTIVQVCVENGQAVDRGQPLFLVRPSEPVADQHATPATA